MWQAALENVGSSFYQFFFGLGSFVGGRFIGQKNFESTNQGASAVTLDNSWLELWVDEGFIGIGFLIFFFWRVVMLIRGCAPGMLRSLCFVIATILLFRSFFVSSLMLHTNFFLFLLIVLCAVIERRANRGLLNVE
jgi:hypothetical protein